MSKPKKLIPKADIIRSSAAEYLTFVAATGDRAEAIEVRYQDENVWMTQRMMATMYGVRVSAVNQRLKHLTDDGELHPPSTIKKYFTTVADEECYETNHSNLQATIAVGFKVENERAVQFRKWTGQVVRESNIQGWAMDTDRLKQGYLYKVVAFSTKYFFYSFPTRVNLIYD